MKRCSLFLSAILLILFISCKDKRRSSVPDAPNRVTLNLSDADSTGFKMSSVCSGVDYITLETNAKSLLGSIDKVLLADNKIFVMDKKITKSVLAFDKNGTFLYRLNTNSSADGKFSSLTDFTIDKQNNLLYVLSNDESLVYRYDFRDGHFISYFRINGTFDRITFINENKFMLSRDGLNRYLDNRDYRICFINEHGKYLSGWIYSKPNRYVNSGSIGNSFNAENDEFYVSRMFMDSVYRIDKTGTLQCQYVFNFGNKSLDRKKFYNAKSTFDMNQVSNNSDYLTSILFSNKRFLVTYYVVNAKSLGCFLLDKEKKKSYFGPLINDFDDVPLGVINYLDDKYLVTSIAYNDLRQLFDVTKSKMLKKPKTQQLYAQTAKRDNPTLLFFKFK